MRAFAALIRLAPLGALGLGLGACRLNPLVDDVPGASANILPKGSSVPLVTKSADLTNQIAINDGLDDGDLADAGNVITRGTGKSGGATVRYWSFGTASRAPSPLYQFFSSQGGTLVPLDHPALVDAFPGDPGYSPLHTLFQVVVTAKYDGQIFPDTDALSDAVDLGLVNAPLATGKFAATPIVLPGVMLEVGGSNPPVPAQTIYGDGFAAGFFQLGGALGVQPVSSLIPQAQVSLLRGLNQAAFDTATPIFQETIPTTPPTTSANYTPLSVVVDVDLTVSESDINSDTDLFVRTGNAISTTKSAVNTFQITTTSLLLPLQFTEGMP